MYNFSKLKKKIFLKLSCFEKLLGGGTAGCVIAANGGIRSGTPTQTGKLDKNDTPGPRIMRIHLVRNSTSARFGKKINIHIVRIYSTIVNFTYYSLRAKIRTS